MKNNSLNISIIQFELNKFIFFVKCYFIINMMKKKIL